MKLFTKTFGCQMNFADSDEMGRHFKTRGFAPTEDPFEADAVLVNTCTVRDLAEHKAMSFIGALKEWKDRRKGRFLIVTGCAAERAKDEMRRKFGHIDLIVGAKDISEFPGHLDRMLNQKKFFDTVIEESLADQFLPESGPVVQYVTIMRGCNYSCSYCIVPAVRGREVYRPAADILAEVADRVKEGAKEIWLLGQTVNSYRPAPSTDYEFADLLHEVGRVPGAERVRFMSPHPFYLTPKLINAMAGVENVCEHLHLPVQSGSDRMLVKMRRNYTRASYLASLDVLRQAVPGIAVTTDIIVGYPGETEQDFELTLSLVEEANFDSAYCFKYSPRPGTRSAEERDDVPPEIKEERVNRVLALADSRGAEKAKALIGTLQEVLIEDDKGGGVFRGKTRGAWRVRFQDSSLQVGQTIQARIVATHSRELHGVNAAAHALHTV